MSARGSRTVKARGAWQGLGASALALALGAVAALPGCGGAGGGSGSGSGSGGAAASGASGPATVRLVGFDRRALSPAAGARISLVVERPATAAPGAFSLEESGDGLTYSASGYAPAAVLPSALLYDLPVPPAPRWYRITAPVPSNRVAVDPAAILAAPVPSTAFGGGAPATTLASPLAGSIGVARRPYLSVAGGPGAQSFLYAVADEEGTLAWLAESASPSLTLGAGAGARTFLSPGASGLAAGATHVATVVALDAECFGLATGAAARAEFTTAP